MNDGVTGWVWIDDAMRQFWAARGEAFHCWTISN